MEMVRGGAAPEDLAAVLAVLAAVSGSRYERLQQLGRSGPPEPSGYGAWRRTRLATLARSRDVRAAEGSRYSTWNSTR